MGHCSCCRCASSHAAEWPALTSEHVRPPPPLPRHRQAGLLSVTTGRVVAWIARAPPSPTFGIPLQLHQERNPRRRRWGGGAVSGKVEQNWGWDLAGINAGFPRKRQSQSSCASKPITLREWGGGGRLSRDKGAANGGAQTIPDMVRRWIVYLYIA